MTALRSPDDILATELKEIYSAELQLSRAIPKLTELAESEVNPRMLDESDSDDAEEQEEGDSRRAGGSSRRIS
jgi:ferritin-like metal-binding protein YciE